MKKCKNKNDIIKRFDTFYRLARIKGFEPGLPSPKIFGSEPTKTGLLTIDNIIEGL